RPRAVFEARDGTGRPRIDARARARAVRRRRTRPWRVRRLTYCTRPPERRRRRRRAGCRADRRSTRPLRRDVRGDVVALVLWFFLGQTAKPAERVISADPDGWYRSDRGLMGE